jgi:hypothetical protein
VEAASCDWRSSSCPQPVRATSTRLLAPGRIAGGGNRGRSSAADVEHPTSGFSRSTASSALPSWACVSCAHLEAWPAKWRVLAGIDQNAATSPGLVGDSAGGADRRRLAQTWPAGLNRLRLNHRGQAPRTAAAAPRCGR